MAGYGLLGATGLWGLLTAACRSGILAKAGLFVTYLEASRGAGMSTWERVVYSFILAS